MNTRCRYELIRIYGERLLQVYMHGIRQPGREQADQVIKIGSPIIDGLIAKKFGSLDKLHAAFEKEIRKVCSDAGLMYAMIDHIEQFRRAAPVWWAECAAQHYQFQRREMVGGVFEDVKEGKYSADNEL
jgi:hypothetical protein